MAHIERVDDLEDRTSRELPDSIPCAVLAGNCFTSDKHESGSASRECVSVGAKCIPPSRVLVRTQPTLSRGGLLLSEA